MHLLPNDPPPGGDSVEPTSANRRIARRLVELSARHEKTAASLYLLPRAEFERACGAKRRFEHLRDLMRLRLLAARCCLPTGPSATRDAPLSEWPELLRASTRFERLAMRLPQDPSR